MELNEEVKDIKSSDDLSAFISNLASDFAARPTNWNNQTLESFLRAMSAWIDDMDGYYLNRKETIPVQPTWKTFGEILMAAKFYE